MRQRSSPYHYPLSSIHDNLFLVRLPLIERGRRMIKRTKWVDGFEVCVHFNNRKEVCTLPKDLRKCDHICTYVLKDAEDHIVIRRRKRYGIS